MTERAKKLLLLYYKQSRKIRRVSGLPPLTFKAKKAGTLKDYRIYGNTAGGESVGDLVAEGEHAGEYKVAVKVEGKNLCNNIWEQKMINVNTGNESPNGNTVCCDFIPVKPNVTYSCSRTIWNNYNNLRCYGTNKNYLGTGTDLANKGNPLIQGAPFGTFMITDARVSYIRFNDLSNSLDMKYMLVEGVYTAETMPPYEPYYEPVTTNLYLPEPIKMVGDEAEYIDYAEQKIHRVRKNLVSSYLVKPNNGTLYIPVVFAEVDFQPNTEYLITFTVHENGVKLYLNEFIFTSTYYTSELQGKKTVRLKTKDVILSSSYIQGKGWVILKNGKQNPEVFTITDVQIQLASIADDTYEPYIENTDLDVTLPALPVLPGTNVLSVGTEVQPSGVEIKGRIKAAGGD